jgi:hypothetical protein
MKKWLIVFSRVVKLLLKNSSVIVDLKKSSIANIKLFWRKNKQKNTTSG